MSHEVPVREVPEQSVIARRVSIHQSAMGATFAATFRAAYGYLGAADLTPAGPPFVIYQGRDGDRWDVEICAPFLGRPSADVTLPAGLGMARLPAVTVVHTLHRGPYDTLPAAYHELAAWAGAHDYELSGPPRESYLSPPGTPPTEIETVIDQPVTSARVLVPA